MKLYIGLLFISVNLGGCKLLDQIPPDWIPQPTSSPTPSPRVTATEPSPEPTVSPSASSTPGAGTTPTGSPMPSSTPEEPLPSPRPTYKPPTLDRQRNGIHGGKVHFGNIDFGDGKRRKALYMDSTRDYIIPPSYPQTIRVCDHDHDPPLNTWCQGRDWDAKGDLKWSSPGVNKVKSIPNSAQGWAEVFSEFFITTCPPVGNTTHDGIVVPIKGTGCYTAKYQCSSVTCKKVK
jgi:hypothetical protein